MAVGKIIQFPVPEEYTWFLQDSEARLQVLLEALNMAHEKGYHILIAAFYNFILQIIMRLILIFASESMESRLDFSKIF